MLKTAVGSTPNKLCSFDQKKVIYGQLDGGSLFCLSSTLVKSYFLITSQALKVHPNLRK